MFLLWPVLHVTPPTGYSSLFHIIQSPRKLHPFLSGLRGSEHRPREEKKSRRKIPPPCGPQTPCFPRLGSMRSRALTYACVSRTCGCIVDKKKWGEEESKGNEREGKKKFVENRARRRDRDSGIFLSPLRDTRPATRNFGKISGKIGGGLRRGGKGKRGTNTGGGWLTLYEALP